MVKEIPLTQGKVVLVDDEDYDLVSQYKWFLSKCRNTYYAIRHVQKENGTWSTQSIHRYITNYIQTDHINGNGLDNRRENLREVSHAQNGRNVTKTKKKSSSIYKGVSWHTDRQKWRAVISINGKYKHIGLYNDEILAAKSYDSYTRYLYGEFGTYNFPEEGERSAI